MDLRQTLVNEMDERIKRNEIPKRSKEEINTLVNELLAKMTLDEKIGQLYESTYDGADVTGPQFDSSNVVNLIKDGMVGSLLGMNDNIDMYMLQKTAVEKSRLGIPLMFCNDIIHGCRTSFPTNLAMACSFDMKAVEEACNVIAYESAHSGVNITFSPMLDLVRDARWGRVTESYGEDAYLGSEIAKAYVRGFQQGDLSSYDTIGACLKHFVAYGAAEAGREYNTVDISERMLRQFYLPQFKSAIDEGATSIMTSFNIYDSVPVTQNKFLLRNVLRDEFKFEGFTISDYTSSDEIINHKTAKDQREVALKCIKAGLDHEMVSFSYIKELKGLVEDGLVDEKLIDEACSRMLSIKFKLGLFDNPYKNIYHNYEEYYMKQEFVDKAREVAKKSIVLLKNDNNTLPLKNTKEKIALIGPLADTNEVIGAWGGRALNEDCVTLKDGIKNVRGDVDVKVAKGCEIHVRDEKLLNKAIEIAKECDKIILAIGESQHMSGEAHSRAYITIPEVQIELVKELKKLNKPIIVTLFNGRPLELTWLNDNVDAIVEVWFLGSQSGNAIADVLFGDYNPSGKLTMSFPVTVGQLPIYYNQFRTGRPAKDSFTKEEFYVSNYKDVQNEPLYPFGFGLSYTQFDISDIKVDKKELSKDDTLKVTVNVKNIGKVVGTETVQLYIEAKSFSVTRPINELKGFKQVTLQPNEETIVEFIITQNDLAYYNIDMEYVAEEVEYSIRVGNSSDNLIETKIKTIM